MAWDWRKIMQAGTPVPGQPQQPQPQQPLPNWMQQTLSGPNMMQPAPQMQLPPPPTIPYMTFGPGGRSAPVQPQATSTTPNFSQPGQPVPQQPKPAAGFSAPFDYDEGRRTRAVVPQPAPAAPTVNSLNTINQPHGKSYPYGRQPNPYMQEGREGWTTQQTQSGLTPQMNALGYVFDGATGTWIKAPQQTAGTGSGYGGYARSYGGGGGGYTSSRPKQNWYNALTNFNFEA